MPRIKRHTIYDALEAAGEFDKNPANVFSVNADGSQAYRGPVPFPKCVYAPVEDVIFAGSWEETPRGPKYLNEQKAIRHMIVGSKAELEEALASGWFDHPAKALKAIIEENKKNGIEDKRVVPLISAAETISKYEEEIEDLKAKLSAALEAKEIGTAPVMKDPSPFSIKPKTPGAKTAEPKVPPPPPEED